MSSRCPNCDGRVPVDRDGYACSMKCLLEMAAGDGWNEARAELSARMAEHAVKQKPTES